MCKHKIKRHNFLIPFSSLPCSALSPSQNFSFFSLSLSLSRSDFHYFLKYWYTPSVLFSFPTPALLWGKRSSIYSYVDSYFFFFSRPSLHYNSFFETILFSSSPLPLLSPTHVSSNKEGSLSAKRRHTSSSFISQILERLNSLQVGKIRSGCLLPICLSRVFLYLHHCGEFPWFNLYFTIKHHLFSIFYQWFILYYDTTQSPS